ncbi:alpha/beta hydrolase [Nocardia cyriacigeorgica]|uniref:Alpha/beta hydrolase n=1 Tax=Nocardia cyriacigeorgica TaxID=135487 RepID=A0A5R8P8D8_9NOCA|nr:alpha/beta hydrolase [Nocardia cyriacigeorgica]
MVWHGCSDPDLIAVRGECAEIRVPLDYSAPGGRTISLAISRVPSTDPARRRGVLLTNSGGPGGPGLDPGNAVGNGLSADVRAAYDLIGFDPRGVGQSTPVDCGWPPGRVPGGDAQPGLDRAAFDRDVQRAAQLAALCIGAEGAALRHINTRNTARDMRMIAVVLGESAISYYGPSYGSYLGAVFTQMFPERSDRIVLDSVVDPERYWLGMFHDSGLANEAALAAWAEKVAAEQQQFQLGDSGEAVLSTVRDLIARVAQRPIEIAGLTVDDDILLTILNLTLSFGPFAAQLAELLHQLQAVGEGAAVQPIPLWEIVRGWTGASEMFEAHMAVKCGDVAAPRDPEWYWRNIERSRIERPIFGPLFNNIAPCAFWPAPLEPPTRIQHSVPVLLLHADGDIRTPYSGAQSMRRLMSESRLVTLRGVRWHSILGLPSRCLTEAVDAFLLDGKLPAADVECRLDPP